MHFDTKMDKKTQFSLRFFSYFLTHTIIFTKYLHSAASFIYFCWVFSLLRQDSFIFWCQTGNRWIPKPVAHIKITKIIQCIQYMLYARHTHTHCVLINGRHPCMHSSQCVQFVVRLLLDAKAHGLSSLAIHFFFLLLINLPIGTKQQSKQTHNRLFIVVVPMRVLSTWRVWQSKR